MQYGTQKKAVLLLGLIVAKPGLTECVIGEGGYGWQLYVTQTGILITRSKQCPAVVASSDNCRGNGSALGSF